MGAVYEVEHPDFPRPLALKVLKGDVTPEALARFGREAELLARVNHPGVLSIHTLGRTPDGDPYLVTDRIEGEELSQVNRSQRLTWTRSAELARDLAAALVAVHATGVVHRDLKPSNVIVTPSGGPVILDFGIARGTGAESLTQTGTLIGTVAYMSPEQAEASRPVDARADVYALGAILFFLLTGLPPYPGQGMAALAALLRPDVAAPDPSSHNGEIPGELSAICHRAIARDPLKRTHSAQALHDELVAWLAAGQTPTHSTPARRLAASAVSLSLLGLLGAGIWATPDTAPPSPAPFAANSPNAPLTNSPLADSPVADPGPTPRGSIAAASPTPSPSDRERDRGDRELDALQRMWHKAQSRPQEPPPPDPEKRYQPTPDPDFPEDSLNTELDEWLRAYADHPRRGEAQALSRAARRALPLRILQHGPTAHSPNNSLHFFEDEGRSQLLAVAWQRPDLLRWEVSTWRPFESTSLVRPGERTGHQSPRASLVLPPRLGFPRTVLVGGAFGIPVRGRYTSLTSGTLFEVLLEGGEVLRRFPLPATCWSVSALARSPGGLIAVGTRHIENDGKVVATGSLLLLDNDGLRLGAWNLGASVAAISFPKNDALIAIVGQEGSESSPRLVRWLGRERKQERLPTPFEPSSLHVHQGRILAGGSGGELLEIPLEKPWALAEAAPLKRSGPGVVTAPLAGLEASGDLLYAGYGAAAAQTPTGSRELVIWRREAGQYVQARRLGRPIPVLTLAVSPDGKTLALRGRRDRIEIWDALALTREE